MAKLELLSREFPRLRRELSFGEFADELAGNAVDVWLNPSREWMARYLTHAARGKASDEALKAAREADPQPEPEYPMAERNQAAAELYAELWDCAPDEVNGLAAADAGLFAWLVGRSWEWLEQYRAGALAKNPISG